MPLPLDTPAYDPRQDTGQLLAQLVGEGIVAARAVESLGKRDKPDAIPYGGTVQPSTRTSAAFLAVAYD